MALKGKASSGKDEGVGFELLDADTYEARLAAVVDLGEHDGKFGRKRQVALFWELIAPPRQDGKRWVVFKRYTLSFNEKATLRKDLETWRRAPYAENADIDLYKFLGSPWSIEITHSTSGEKTYANVGKVGPVGKERAKQVPMGTLKPFTFDCDEDDIAVVERADWLPYVYGTPVIDLIQLGKRNLGEGDVGATPFDPPPVTPFGGGVAASDDDVPF